MNTKNTVAGSLIKALKDVGVKYVFGVPSGNWIDYLEALRTAEGIEFVLVSNEASGGFMADVHWRLTGNLAACFGTFGPGACNLSTGVCGGYLDRSPMIVLADEMPDEMLSRTAQMNMDHQAFFKPITKWQTRLHPDKVKSTVYEAYEIACSEVPGPVYIGLPAGMGSEIARNEEVERPEPAPVCSPDDSSLEKMASMFIHSRKPVLALGITSLRAGVRDLVFQIADRFQVPVILTPMAKGMIPESHPAYAGVLAHALANQVGATHSQADLVLGIGYDPVEINYEDWMPAVQLIHIDTVPADIDRKRYPEVLDVVGNIKTALEKLLANNTGKKDWDMDALKQRRDHMFAELACFKGELNARAVLSVLREALPQESILTCDVGAHLHLIGQAWKTYSPERQLMTNGCSSMGFGLPAAIAAKLSMPQSTVACVTGDGGFLMMVGELATAMRLGTKVIFVLMSDSHLSLITIKQEKKHHPGYGTSLFSDKYCSANSFFGVPVLAASTINEYKDALARASNADGPVVIEAFVKKEDYMNFILKGST
ncbi:MAG: thiamine pyrophosphate-binding protein [Candidatus Aminicenantaceae bacterium]